MFNAILSPTRRLARQDRKRGVLARLLHLDAVWRQRNDLRNLDDYMLKDLGLTRSQARAETQRPIWDAPSHWM